jgi:hypothetical protein
MERSNSEELLRRANAARVRAVSMGNPIKMSLQDRQARSYLLANAEYLRMMARRIQRS